MNHMYGMIGMCALLKSKVSLDILLKRRPLSAGPLLQGGTPVHQNIATGEEAYISYYMPTGM